MKVERIEDATGIYLRGSICLSDIPKEMIFTSPKNGKKYVAITVTKCGEMKWEHSHEIKTSPNRDESARGVYPKSFGLLKEWKKDVVDTTQPKKEESHKTETTKKDDFDGVPF